MVLLSWLVLYQQLCWKLYNNCLMEMAIIIYLYYPLKYCSSHQDKRLNYFDWTWWRNGHDGISNHRHLKCLLRRLFRHRSKKTSKLCVTGLCEGNSLLTSEFPSQRASNMENVSIWWRHHENGSWLVQSVVFILSISNQLLKLHELIILSLQTLIIGEAESNLMQRRFICSLSTFWQQNTLWLVSHHSLISTVQTCCWGAVTHTFHNNFSPPEAPKLDPYKLGCNNLFSKSVAQQRQIANINQILHTQNMPHASPSWVSTYHFLVYRIFHVIKNKTALYKCTAMVDVKRLIQYESHALHMQRYQLWFISQIINFEKLKVLLENKI